MYGLAQNLIEPWRRLSPNLRGILWITFGSIIFAINDVVVKTLGRTIDPFELAFFRYVVGLIVLAPVFARVGIAGLRTKRPGIHALRLAMACVAQIGVLVSVINLPLANATALTFSRILFTTVVATVLLKEIVSTRRWTVTAIGFVGVLIMVRPGPDGINPIALIAIASALTFAVANVMIRMMSTTEPAIRILFYYHLGGSVVFAGPAIWVWQSPVGVQWVLAIAIGALTTLGMVAFVRGFAIGEASVIGPMEYTRLIYAAILGLVLFSEVPTVSTIAGALLIAGATSYIARTEGRQAKPG